MFEHTAAAVSSTRCFGLDVAQQSLEKALRVEPNWNAWFVVCRRCAAVLLSPWYRPQREQRRLPTHSWWQRNSNDAAEGLKGLLRVVTVAVLSMLSILIK
jgi:hypothetical protein